MTFVWVTNTGETSSLPFVCEYPSDVVNSFGYPALMIERRLLPEALLANLKRPEKVLNHKKVSAVEHFDTEVVVHCTDGTKYECDILVGADGIRSRVRAEMSRLAGVKNEAEDEIKAEYMW